MEKILTNQWVRVVILLMVLSLAVAFSFSHARWREQIRNFTFDNYNIIKPRIASDGIVIIDIDEASLKEIGQMPWPRDVMASLVDRLKEMGASVIVFDIVFAEADRSSPSSVVTQFRGQTGFEDVVTRLESMPDHDVVFGEAIKRAGNVVTGFSFTHEMTGSTPRQAGIFRGRGIEKFVPNLEGASVNLRSINKFAAGNGSFFVSTDTDGIIRRVPMLVAYKKEGSNIVSTYPSLSLETIRVFEGERGGKVLLADPKYAELDPNRFGVEAVRIGKDSYNIPTNARGEFLVYFSKSNPEWYIPAHKVLGETLEPNKVKGKIVFIGTSAVGLKDIRSTPLDPFVPGVELHLNIVDQILQQKFLSRSIEAEGVEAVSIFVVGLFILLLAPFVGALTLAFVVIVSVAFMLHAGWYAFVAHGLLIDIAYPIFSVLTIFLLSTILTYLRTERERRQVRAAFGLYISPDFMKELTKDPDKLRLGGEIRDLTVMFSDIRRFTSISEGLAPEELIQLMNDFLTPMSDLVMQHRGTIDKYMGDAMMAFWNAPLDDEKHARNACLTALGMQAALAPINEQVREKAEVMGKEPVLLNAGIGINTGPCAVGNMGSKQRFAYSTLGDAVNLASRLEGQTKVYNVPIILGEKTKAQIDGMATLELDVIKVKGKSKPVRIFTLVGDEDYASRADFRNWSEKHQQMIDGYQEQDFDAVFKCASECRVLSDGKFNALYEIYQKRVSELLRSPPGKDWDGVYVATEK
ncbi:MAG: guanylate cyclase [Micavibrio sp.]|nr:MAG: guanylate cyclase [Micavibrio sp.]